VSVPQVGERVDRVEIDVSLRRMIVNVGAGWDFFPGHHDVDYARAHGHPTIFANTSLFLALADRVVTDWAGPRARIVRRRLTMRRPVHLGDVLYGEGDVVAVRGDDDGPRQVDVTLRLGNGDGVCADAEATLELP
jgi:acyl dehydratase